MATHDGGELARHFDEMAPRYDSKMLQGMGLAPFYEAVAEQFEGLEDGFALLDLGVGTGLQLERLFARWPAMRVTGVDLSAGMLERLRAKFPGRSLAVRQGSFLEVDLGRAVYDCALTTYALHHLRAEEKAAVYRRVWAALVPGGFMVEGDLAAATPDEAEARLAEMRRKLAEGSIPPGGHFDLPSTAEQRLQMMRAAGFTQAEVVRRWENTALIKAYR